MRTGERISTRTASGPWKSTSRQSRIRPARWDGTAPFDLVVRNGTLVIPGLGAVAADVGIAGGQIVALGESLAGPAAETYDARGKVVLPGIVDPHVHIGNELSFEV